MSVGLTQISYLSQLWFLQNFELSPLSTSNRKKGAWDTPCTLQISNPPPKEAIAPETICHNRVALQLSETRKNILFNAHTPLNRDI